MAQLYPQAPGAHFSRLLRQACVTVGLFLFSGHHTGKQPIIIIIIIVVVVVVVVVIIVVKNKGGLDWRDM
jgi:hypothetical protein